MFDLILRGGHLVDASQGIDARCDVAFSGGKVAAIRERIDGVARDTRDITGLFVAPGLIDLHTHVYWGGTSIGVDAAAVARRGGTTTLVDAGSAGPGNFPGFRRHVIEPSTVRILAYLNISFPGIFAFSKPVMVGECVDIRLLDPAECVRVINENRDHTLLCSNWVILFLHSCSFSHNTRCSGVSCSGDRSRKRSRV